MNINKQIKDIKNVKKQTNCPSPPHNNHQVLRMENGVKNNHISESCTIGNL